MDKGEKGEGEGGLYGIKKYRAQLVQKNHTEIERKNEGDRKRERMREKERLTSSVLQFMISKA